MTPILARIEKLFTDRGAAEYHGEAVTQLEHALQCAALAEADGHPPETVAAALLHDIGHLLHPPGDRGVDDRHEALGTRFLAAHFGPGACEPVRLHVAAKRYLCATDPAYRAALSPASEMSLQLQGGPMSVAEVRSFENEPYYTAVVAVRKYDDRAKVPGLPTPPLAHFLPFVEAARAVRG